MKQNLTNLAIYLSQLYFGAYVSQEALDQIETLSFTSEATRYEIISAIDQILHGVNPSNLMGTIENLEISPLDNDGFKLKFKAVPKGQEKKQESTKLSDLLNLLKSGKTGTIPNSGIIGPFSIPLDDKEITGTGDEEEKDQVLNELEVISIATGLIAQIERHQIQQSSTSSNSLYSLSFRSALNKYIPAIEKYYLKPYLNVVDDTEEPKSDKK